MFADGGEDFTGHPLLEPLGFRFAGPEDQGVEARLVDDGDVSIRIGGQARIIDQSFLILIEILGSITGIGEPKDITDILGDEPGVTVLVGDTYVESPASGQRELEGGDDVVHGVCSLPIGKARVKPHPCQPPAPTTRGN